MILEIRLLTFTQSIGFCKRSSYLQENHTMYLRLAIQIQLKLYTLKY